MAFSKVGDYRPEFFDSDWKTYRRYVPKSSVSVPIRIGGEVVGAVGFGAVRKERIWSPRFNASFGVGWTDFWKRPGTKTCRRRKYPPPPRAYSCVADCSYGRIDSVAHPPAQPGPIGAILINAEEIQNMLESAQPDLGSIRAAMADIIQDDLRASETIKGLRSFFRKSEMLKRRST